MLPLTFRGVYFGVARATGIVLRHKECAADSSAYCCTRACWRCR
jgi:hypothetical protein